MKTIIFIADLFVENYIGGGELNNEEVIKRLKDKNYNLIKINSNRVTVDFIKNNKDCFFIVGNFISLSEECKGELLNLNYIIYEHDHKYLSSRNPGAYLNFLSNEKNIINKNFYKNAIAVFCQSKIHSEVVWKNLGIKNIINCSGNLWSEDQLVILEKFKDSEKLFDHAILQSNNGIKNTQESIEYCQKNNLSFKLIPFTNFENYVAALSKCKKLVFFPKVLETLSRTSIEAKILGCKLVTNNLLGAASEEWIKTNPEEILNYIKNNSEVIIEKIISCVEKENQEKYFYQFEKMPKISIITSVYKAKKYIKNYLETITKQTIFDECELIFVDPNSPDEEYKLIEEYQKKYNNIKYIKLEQDPGIYGCWNIGIKHSTGDFVCNSNVDDVRNIDNLEILRKHLYFNKDVDLVYGDACEVNELPELNKNYLLKLSEHSISEFSEENMIKCLPGPLPLWKKSMHDKHGIFEEKYTSAGDWEMWLRAVSNGSKFKKVDVVSGYYYNNPNGKSTSQEFANKKFLEEKDIFFKYKEIFGKNYNKYLNWFSREIK